MIKIGDYDKIMSDRDLFNQVVYTPLSEAMKLLAERRQDEVLKAKTGEKLAVENIPEPLRGYKKCAVLFRQVATPNYETRHFVSIAKEYGLQPIIFEYHDDKFTSNNEFKHSLGQIRIHNGFDAKGESRKEKITIVDFAKFDGETLKHTKTVWGEPLVDFHKRLFTAHHLHEGLVVHDLSAWCKSNGPDASSYYSVFLQLFVCNGVLFDNFLISGKETGFTRGVILPAIEGVLNLMGAKPLIVPLGPFDNEAEEYWVHHHPTVKDFIESVKR